MSSLKKENKYYYIYYRDKHGRQFHKSLKTSSLTVARKIQKEIDNRLALERFNLYNPLYTLAQAKETYLQKIEGRKAPRTIETEIRLLDKLIKYFSGGSSANITKDEAERFIAQVFSDTSPTTANIAIRELKAIYNYFIKFNIVSENPFVGIPLYKTIEKEIQYFTSGEIETLLKLSGNSWLKNWILFALATGLRRNEIKSIHQENINWKDSLLTVAVKRQKLAYVALNKIALDVLKEQIEKYKQDEVFPEPVFPETVSKKFKRLLIKSNIKRNLTFHNLRHTFASFLIQDGVPIEVIKKMLNHQDIKTTQIYAHLSPGNLASASSVIQNILQAINP
ncbi:MAG: putative tyrosine recombinase XerC-like protein [Candidatus Methanofastidiosum methylothiophilum]|uniref:Putative tyrosine recombinase XerC-like protein n=1 Tax=Candidatus Methanofastidiosum methylothiophilum TaxID=1705564 RepID=A0A150ISD9_9EURY|nr:MAG: putative tyrosine recombinase XerC-like protein [Candidatus Methanofastidiosum methylthiophilus]KYC53555.1 MAG: putative tyrosine recombinase XerC-like protein [Candidatus Methanofastidiosum methylthiophilus]